MRKLEDKYARELVVIGVHSAKFTTERGTQNIREAIWRHHIAHPVVNDAEFRIWQAYAVRAWPTLVLISPDGHYLGSHAGEITFEMFDPVIAQAIAEYDARGLIDRRRLNFRPERMVEPGVALCFPAKVLADPAGRRLFIADSGHHRLLLVSLSSNGIEGQIEAVIGSGVAGLRDGDFATAAFNDPHGMALAGDVLYVADTENHAIRAVHLHARTVETVAGTGEQSHVYPLDGGPGRQTALSSPWDVLAHDGILYIAMAGSHQLWALNLETYEVWPYAGTGREALIDGPLSRCALNQPSGLAADGRKLYFADSEASAIRWADLPPANQVGTIVGTGLFDFGDADGAADAVRLQHPLGLVYYAGQLIVADTYNNKIKIVEPQARRATTFLGTGEDGWCDGPGDQARFDEPGGVSVADGLLYIADTNNHLVRVADLATRNVATLQLTGLEKVLPNRMRQQ